MFLQNLTMLTSNAVVTVTNIAPPAPAAAKTVPSPAEIAERAPPAMALPILPAPQAVERSAPQRSTQIVVTSSKPGAIASTTVYTGEPGLNGVESARRAAQAAADRAHLQGQVADFAAALWQPVDEFLDMPSNRDAAIRAYAEAARLGVPDPVAEAIESI